MIVLVLFLLLFYYLPLISKLFDEPSFTRKVLIKLQKKILKTMLFSVMLLKHLIIKRSKYSIIKNRRIKLLKQC